MTRRATAAAIACGVSLLAAAPVVVRAHSGPPYPIVTERTVGAYAVAVWADPDVTDDGSAAGQFWVVVHTANQPATLPAGTRAEVSIRPTDRVGEERKRQTEPVKGDVTRQFAALLLDHEGPFAVHIAVDGVLGKAEVDATVDATYDLRPAPVLMVLFLAPFLLAGFLWGKLLLQRHRLRAITSRHPPRE
jgi:hypothetical protein